MAIEKVWEHLLEKYDGNVKNALLYYKGAKTNMKGVQVALNAYKKIDIKELL